MVSPPDDKPRPPTVAGRDVVLATPFFRVMAKHLEAPPRGEPYYSLDLLDYVSIVAATLEGATLIPAAAILPNAEGETIVLIVDDQNVAHETVVQIGVREPEMVQIVAGVEVGQRVVTQGGLGLEDKTAVRILKPGEKAAGEKVGRPRVKLCTWDDLLEAAGSPARGTPASPVRGG